MIARLWHGRVKHEDAAAYRKFLRRRVLPDYRSVEGNIEVKVLERRESDAARCRHCEERSDAAISIRQASAEPCPARTALGDCRALRARNDAIQLGTDPFSQ